MGVAISRLDDLPIDILDPLLEESEREGWRFLRRLADEWQAGTNRFDRPGEGLFAAWADAELVGVCGLNTDPYGAATRIGRVRRLYVARCHRRCGVGRKLVEAVVRAAKGQFGALRVRTENPKAARLYERLGFAAVGMADCTHTLILDSRLV
jgi:GNAT superfamily N-acetyltransferase